MKNGFGLGNNRDKLLYPRYKMEGSVSQGEYNLRIVNVEMDDDDEFACQVGELKNEPSRTSNPAKLTVLGKFVTLIS